MREYEHKPTSEIMKSDESSNKKMQQLNTLFKEMLFADADDGDIRDVVEATTELKKEENKNFSFERFIPIGFKYFFNYKLNRVLGSKRERYVLIMHGKYGDTCYSLEDSYVASDNVLAIIQNNMNDNLYNAKSSDLDEALNEKYDDEHFLSMFVEKDMLGCVIRKHVDDNNPRQLIQILGYMLRSDKLEDPKHLKNALYLIEMITFLYDSVTLWRTVKEQYINPKIRSMNYRETVDKYGDFYRKLLEYSSIEDENKTVMDILNMAKTEYIKAGFLAFCFLKDRQAEYETCSIEPILHARPSL